MATTHHRARNKRLLTYLWVALLALVTIILIYKEQTAVLYILATLGVTAILVVVAFADLHKGEPDTSGSSPTK